MTFSRDFGNHVGRPLKKLTDLSIEELRLFVVYIIETLPLVSRRMSLSCPEKGGWDYSGSIENNFHVTSCKEMWERLYFLFFET